MHYQGDTTDVWQSARRYADALVNINTGFDIMLAKYARRANREAPYKDLAVERSLAKPFIRRYA